jgi:hypothetical protein
MSGIVYAKDGLKLTRNGSGHSVTLDINDVQSAVNLLIPSESTRMEGFNAVRVSNDFIGPASSTLPPELRSVVSGTGNTADYSGSASCGEFVMTHSNTSEAQMMRLSSGDALWVNLSKKPIFHARVKITPAGATMSADQRIVVGLGSAYNSTLDSVATNAWFRFEGANLNILTESDDGTTDDDDNDSGIDWVKGTYMNLTIDCSSLSAVRFKVNSAWIAATLDLSGVAANTLVQPLFVIQRDAGTEQDVLTIDWFEVTQER